MSARLFGTDGIRARFGDEPLTEPTVRRIGVALGAHLADRAPAGAPLRVAIGGDTRASTPSIVEWLGEGLASAGVGVWTLGVVPTPTVAWWIERLGAAAGIAVSASHNPAADNGIKFFDARGFKWAVAEERAFEERLAAASEPPTRPAPGPPTPIDGSERYLRWLLDEGGGRRALEGRRVALDTANGAASRLAAPLFRALGAEVRSLFAAPDGGNINRGCGSTEPAALLAEVAAGGCDFGFAFDGDADRCLLVDERGELRDGDAMLYLWARDLVRRGELAARRVVATKMSNLGLERALGAIGVDVVRSDVGDREVVAALRRDGLRLGGEQSGHLVDLHRSTTGDGLLTAAILASILARSSRPASAELADFRRFPQVLENVAVARKPDLATLEAVAAAVREAEAELGAEGRLVLRYSGTEPLARVMIEGPDEATIRRLAGAIVEAIRNEIGVPA